MAIPLSSLLLFSHLLLFENVNNLHVDIFRPFYVNFPHCFLGTITRGQRVQLHCVN